MASSNEAEECMVCCEVSCTVSSPHPPYWYSLSSLHGIDWHPLPSTRPLLPSKLHLFTLRLVHISCYSEKDEVAVPIRILPAFNTSANPIASRQDLTPKSTCTIQPCGHSVCDSCRRKLCREMLLPSCPVCKSENSVLCPKCRVKVAAFCIGDSIFSSIPGTLTWEKSRNTVSQQRLATLTGSSKSHSHQGCPPLTGNSLQQRRNEGHSVFHFAGISAEVGRAAGSHPRVSASSRTHEQQASSGGGKKGDEEEEEEAEEQGECWEVVGAKVNEHKTSSGSNQHQQPGSSIPELRLGARLFQSAPSRAPAWAREFATRCVAFGPDGASLSISLSPEMGRGLLKDGDCEVLAAEIGSIVVTMASNMSKDFPGVSFDCSKNAIGDSGVRALCEMLGDLYHFQIAHTFCIKAYKNVIGDIGAGAIAALIGLQGRSGGTGHVVREAHLSHNHITDAGASIIIEATQAYPYRDGHAKRALWLRLEQNYISKGFIPKCTHCLAEGQHCNPHNCSGAGMFLQGGPQVHLPHLHFQKY